MHSDNEKTISRMEKAGRISRLSVVWIVVLVLLAIGLGLYAGEYAKFNPINGTFQNFNPVRRLLNGQVPYKDFQDYLGFGHLFTGTAATLLFGGTYRASLVAFTVLTFLGSAALFAVIGWCVAGRKQAVFFTAFCVLFFLGWQFIDKFRPAFPGNAPTTFSVGNSARILRASILPLSALLLLGIRDMRGVKRIILCALISAAAFLWCNDYGISCWLCIAIMDFIIMLAKRTKFLKALLLTAAELLLSLLFIFILVELFTLGGFRAWFSSTFGTGGYQSWYYNSNKSHYLFDLDHSIAVIIHAILCIYYLIRLIMERGSSAAVKRYGVPAFICMVNVCAANEYKLLSGNYLQEASEIALGTLIIAEIFAFVSGRFPGGRKAFWEKAYTALKILLAAVTALAAAALIVKSTGAKEGTYVPQLGGYNAELGADLLETSAFINGRSFFAAYASAQEVVEDTFQPSGTDYIIHVLGDRPREEYLEAFHSSGAELTATISEEYSFYEYWVQRANWFFYRELYSGWHPVYSNTYELYWEKNSQPGEHVHTEHITVEIEDSGEASKKLIVRTGENVYGVADVFVDFASARKGGLSSALLFDPMTYVRNTGRIYACSGSAPMPYFDSNWLRAESAEYIPVPVSGGYGELTLTAMPEKDMVLEVREASCERVFTVLSDYIHISDAGISDEGDLVLSVPLTIRNSETAENLECLELAGERYEVASVENGDVIRITLPSGYADEILPVLKRENMAGCLKGAA